MRSYIILAEKNLIYLDLWLKFKGLPPYSPDLNPIEEAFSKFKQYIKKQKARTENRLLNVIKDALNTITRNDAIGYFNHAAEF